MATKPLLGLVPQNVGLSYLIELFQIFYRQTRSCPIQRNDYASESQSVMRTGLLRVAIVKTSCVPVPDL